MAVNHSVVLSTFVLALCTNVIGEYYTYPVEIVVSSLSSSISYLIKVLSLLSTFVHSDFHKLKKLYFPTTFEQFLETPVVALQGIVGAIHILSVLVIYS